MSDLDNQGQRLLALLVSRLPKKDSFISYKDVHTALNLPVHGKYGDSLKQQGLNSLAEWTFTTGKPGITGLIIDQENFRPGDGYFRLYGKKRDDNGWWLDEIKKSNQFDWSPFLSNTSNAKSDSDDDWTNEELAAAVDAYVEMLRKERAREAFAKTSYYETLAAKFGRSEGAFEYRMQNISYVLSLMGRKWIPGLKPARNVGARVAVEIESLLAKAENRTLVPVVAFEIDVRENLKKNLPEPKGNKSPKTGTSEVMSYRRDASVKAWVLRQANGICECCSSNAPFKNADGEPYLEVHHLRQLGDDGTDTVSNAAAICPNCHRELHYGENAQALLDGLYARIGRLIRE